MEYTEEYVKNKFGKGEYDRRYAFLDKISGIKPDKKEIIKRNNKIVRDIIEHPYLIFKTENPEIIDSFLKSYDKYKKYETIKYSPEILRKFYKEREKYIRKTDPYQHMENLLNLEPNELYRYCNHNVDTLCNQKGNTFFKREYLLRHFHAADIEDVFSVYDILRLDDLYTDKKYVELVITYLSILGLNEDNVKFYYCVDIPKYKCLGDVAYLTDTLDKAILLRFIKEYKSVIHQITKEFKTEYKENFIVFLDFIKRLFKRSMKSKDIVFLDNFKGEMYDLESALPEK